MNIMRKFLSQGSTSLSSPTDPEGGGADAIDGAPASAPPHRPEQDTLRLSHLKKLFHEYQNPQHPLSDSEKEEKLYTMFPLFCKVFSNCAPGAATDTFPEIISFAEASCRLLVSEVRRRAGNASTEAAANAIAAFMEVNETSEESSSGWMLLNTLNILGIEGDAISEVSHEAERQHSCETIVIVFKLYL